MFNTIAPLDMLFLRGGTVIAIARKVPVCPALPCPSYGPDQPSDGVVELAAGEADRLGIQPGDLAKIGQFSNDNVAIASISPFRISVGFMGASRAVSAAGLSRPEAG